MEALDAINKRRSVRGYSERVIDNRLRKDLEDYCRDLDCGPFKTAVRFKLLDLEPLSIKELKSLGTYGIIRGAHHYILSAAREEPGSMEDIGYCLEKIILKATAAGLGTCWLGGTFRRSGFAARMQLAADEILPAITPVGYPVDHTSAAGAKHRKPWSDLFFNDDGITPLTETGSGDYSRVLEAVRVGPSASNRQPWRIIKDPEGCFHLYLKEDLLYNRMLGKVRLQNIDMGIAMCHFELAAGELGLAGKWQTGVSVPDRPGLKHIASWFASPADR